MSSFVFPLANLPGVKINVRRKPMFKTAVQEAVSGKELRASWWSFPRYRYTLTFEGLRSQSTYQEFQTLVGFLGRHLGQFDSFLFQDPEDNAVTNHGFGVGNGSTTAFQLQRNLGGFAPDVLGNWANYNVPRTNLLAYSEAMDNAAWTKVNITISPNATMAPNGSLTVELLTPNGSITTYMYQAQTIATGTAYTLSCYMKAGTSTQSALRVYDSGLTTQVARATFGWSGGVPTMSGLGGSASAASVQSVGGGWYRLSMTYTSATYTSVAAMIYADFLNLGGSVYAWAAQHEVGSAATRYILSTTAGTVATPNYWPAAGDGFEPVTELNGVPTIYVGGVAKASGTDFTISSTGVVTFASAPASGAVLTWTGNYWRRVRLAADEAEFERVVINWWKNETLELISVK